MFVTRLVLQNFRNYENVDVSFGPDRIYITGNNGIGKTNILEAIHYLTLGRSFRKAEDKELIRDKQEQASIYLEYYSEKDQMSHHLSCIISKKGKLFAFDDEKVKYLSSILGKLVSVYYEPSLVFFFKDEPEQRRRLLDETLCQISPQYLYALSRYKKLLKERNAAMQQDYDSDVINAYRDQLINLSYRIVKDRKDLIKLLSNKAQNYYNSLFGEERRKLTLTYKTNCPLDDDQESYRKNSLELFSKNQSIENIKKVTAIGPHRDDLTGKLNGNDIAGYGSQGENRLASLALKLAILDLLSDKLGARPILLLDDVTSDLDDIRSENLLRCISKENQQVFVTGTKIYGGFKNYQTFRTNGSEITKEVSA